MWVTRSWELRNRTLGSPQLAGPLGAYYTDSRVPLGSGGFSGGFCDLQNGRQPAENTDPLKAPELFSVSEILELHRKNSNESTFLFYLKKIIYPSQVPKKALRSGADGELLERRGEFAVGGRPK